MRESFKASIVGCFLLTCAIPAAAQSFGLGDQVLTLGAAEFHPAVSTTTYGVAASFYLFGTGTFTAALKLPDGAEIFQYCLYGYVDDALEGVQSGLHAMKLVPGGQPAGNLLIPGGFVQDFIPIGYGTVCTDVFSYVFHDSADIDDDGSSDHIAHVFQVDVFGNAGLGGVRVFWRRQVSPAPAVATFNDVPVSDPAYPYIEALVASAVTAGCGGGNFCPDAPLTRRQMAVFLSKALGLHWAN